MEAINKINNGVSLWKAGISIEKGKNTAWRTTGKFLHENKVAILGSDNPTGKLPVGRDPQEYRKELTTRFQVCWQIALEQSGEVIPVKVTGISGKVIESRDKDGNIKFRSITASANIIKSLSSIWLHMEEFGFDSLWEKGDNLKGKTALEQAYKNAHKDDKDDDGDKDKETPQDALKRGAKLIRDAIKKAGSTDISLFDIEISAIMAEWDTRRELLVAKKAA